MRITAKVLYNLLFEQLDESGYIGQLDGNDMCKVDGWLDVAEIAVKLNKVVNREETRSE